MDFSTAPWPSEPGLENSSFENQYDFMNLFDDQNLAAFLGDENPNISLPENYSSSSSSTSSVFSINGSTSTTNMCPSIEPNQISVEPNPMVNIEQPSTHNYNSSNHNFHPTSSTPIILNFGNVNSPPSPNQVITPAEVTITAQTNKKTGRVRPSYDHIIAERKRRELLSQSFVALSAIVPGLKKMDKTSVLGDAIKYLKQLQERVTTLEEQVTRQSQTIESAVLVKRSQILVEDDGSSYDKNSFDEQMFPQIEARACNNFVRVRIHVKKHKGYLLKILGEVEKFNLNILNANVMPFGKFALEISIVAEMEKESNLSVKEIVRTLGSIFPRA